MADKSLYDCVVDLSTGDGGVPRDKCDKPLVRVRLTGARANTRRSVSLPVVIAEFQFVNDCDSDVTVKRGVAPPARVGAGEVVNVLVGDGPNDMRVVR